MKLHRGENSWEETSNGYSFYDKTLSINQTYTLIPFWIRNVFRDKSIPYKGMLDSEVLKQYISQHDIDDCKTMQQLISDLKRFYTSKNSVLKENVMGNKIANMSYYPLANIWKQWATDIEGKCTPKVSPCRSLIAEHANDFGIYVDTETSYNLFGLYKTYEDNKDISDTLYLQKTQKYNDMFSRFCTVCSSDKYKVSGDNKLEICDLYNEQINIPMSHNKTIVDKGYSLYRIDEKNTLIFIEDTFFLPIINQWPNMMSEYINTEYIPKDKWEEFKPALIEVCAPIAFYSPNSGITKDTFKIVLPYGLDGRMKDFTNYRVNNTVESCYIKNNSITKPYYRNMCQYFYGMTKDILNDAYLYESLPRLAKTRDFISLVSGI